MRWTMRTAIFLFVASATTALAQSNAARRVSWNTDVRPALEAGVCFEAVHAERKAETVPCPAAAKVAPVLAELPWLMASRMELIFRMPSLKQPVAPAPPTTPDGPPDFSAPDAALRKVLLDDRRIVAGLMPDVMRALAAKHLECDGCPAASGPVRELTLAELKPYLAPFVWPSAIQPDGSISVHICVGINGLKRMAHVDPDLADAAVLSIMGNKDATARIFPLIKQAKAGEAFVQAKTDEEKLDALRSQVAVSLPTDADFVAAVAARAAELLPQVGMRCTDCRPKPAPESH